LFGQVQQEPTEASRQNARKNGLLGGHQLGLGLSNQEAATSFGFVVENQTRGRRYT